MLMNLSRVIFSTIACIFVVLAQYIRTRHDIKIEIPMNLRTSSTERFIVFSCSTKYYKFVQKSK